MGITLPLLIAVNFFLVLLVIALWAGVRRLWRLPGVGAQVLTMLGCVVALVVTYYAFWPLMLLVIVVAAR